MYIAAVRRSGSNLLSEALSAPPHCFVFREPGLARGQFRLQPNVIELFREHGVDLRKLRGRMQKGDPERALDFFEHELLPALAGVVRQVGIKEIKHDGWQRLLARVPSVRVLLLGRDPRDIYLSLRAKQRDRGVAFGEVDPDRVGAEIRRTFAAQREIEAAQPSLRVRYEDFCTDPAVFEEVARFTESELTEPGMVGALNRHNRRLRGERIAGDSVERWRREADADLLREAQAALERVPEYAAYWNYAPGG